tara:strand:- start:939 stop:1220 length:282 start_codon:yes stop_codon:yes gene_type:complete
MKVKRTFHNSRRGRFHFDYVDTNNYLFIILFKTDAELHFILRDLKKNKSIISYIYKKINKRFDNIMEIESCRISDIEYNLMKQKKIPSIIKIC